LDAVFDNVKLLITHYNRSQSLERLLCAFERLGLRFHEIVVSDDCSVDSYREHLINLKDRFGFTLLTSSINKGLANNLNKAHKYILTPYTLYVQEDFVPTSLFPNTLIDGLSLIEMMPEVDLIRFYAYMKHRYLTPVSDGFSRMDFHYWKPGFKQFYCYSDHPHMRRNTFQNKFGTFVEGIHSDKSEFRMVLSFLSHKGIALIHDNYQGLFLQENDMKEPSTVRRPPAKKYLQSTNFFLIRMVRVLYRNFKYRVDLFLFRSQSS
jgi:glycosyltransferase involved in cell wall biosynthesis